MSLQQLVIDSQSVGMRLDLFLARRFLDAAGSSGFSRSGIQRLITGGQVTLNGQRVKSSARLKIDDLVQMESIPPREISLKPEPIPLKILYEDDDCVVINKAAGMVVHPAAGRISGTLVNALLHHCPSEKRGLSIALSVDTAPTVKECRVSASLPRRDRPLRSGSLKSTLRSMKSEEFGVG